MRQTDTKEEAPEVSATEVYRLFVERELLIHKHLNMLQRSQELAQGLVWIPTEEASKFTNAAGALGYSGFSYQKLDENLVDKLSLTRPTKFYCNEFFAPFQQLIDMYGNPTYREANPAVFACVSFPFLFGVMFGDIMHGSLLVAFGTYLCWAPRAGWLTNAFIPYRHLTLLLGLFATYAGFIYNDFAAFGTEFFGKSCWTPDKDEKKIDDGRKLVPGRKKDCVYAVGIDPIWYRSDLEVSFLNSFKMKISVVFGVAQMLLGTSLRIGNFTHQKRWLELFVVGFTQFAMMAALFGFMNYLVIVKWLTDFVANQKKTGLEPPSVI